LCCLNGEIKIYFRDQTYNGPKIGDFGGLEGKILRIKVETSLGNEFPPKHIIQCKKCDDAPRNVFSRAWQEKL